MARDRWVERGMTAMLVAVVLLPGILAGVCLGLSFAFAPAEIAAGQHLGALQGQFAQCSGCALCGMSRAFSAVSHGELGAALRFNRGVALGYPLAWLCVAVSMFCSWRTLRDRPRFFAAQTARASVSNAQEGHLHV